MLDFVFDEVADYSSTSMSQRITSCSSASGTVPPKSLIIFSSTFILLAYAFIISSAFSS